MENKIISKNELSEIIQKACEEGMLIQRTINDKYDIPATRIKKYIDKILNTEPSEINFYTILENISNNKLSYKINIPKNKIKNNTEILNNFMKEHKLVFSDNIDFYINDVKQEFEDKKPDNFICQQCGNMETDKMCSKYCVSEFVEKQKDKITGWREPTEEELKENFLSWNKLNPDEKLFFNKQRNRLCYNNCSETCGECQMIKNL